jgi:hypothetical protein
MSSNSSRSYNSPFSFSAYCSRWLTWRACAASSSSFLVTALARASIDAYNSCASTRVRWESASHWAMASTYRSKPCCRARAAALLDIVIHLSMLAHSWRQRHSSARSSPSWHRTRCACDSAWWAVLMTSLTEMSPGA